MKFCSRKFARCFCGILFKYPFFDGVVVSAEEIHVKLDSAGPILIFLVRSCQGGIS